MAKKDESGRKVPVAKNDEIQLTITDMSVNGEGIGRTGGYALFVKDAMPGDDILAKVIKVKKTYGYARLMKILVPSKDRVEPPCPVARQCGGCQIMHCSYESQLRWKESKVADCLRRIGNVRVLTKQEWENAQNEEEAARKGLSGQGKHGESKNLPEKGEDASLAAMKDMEGDNTTILMEEIIGMEEPWHYRNKAQFPVGRDKEGNIVIGFYAGRTHNIVPQTDCLIQDAAAPLILDCIKKWMQQENIMPYDEKSGKGVVRHVLLRSGFYTKEIMVCLVVNQDTVPASDILVDMLSRLDLQSCDRKLTGICASHNTKNTNVILGKKISLLYGRDYIEDKIGDIIYQISVPSFYQVNPVQTEKLYETALEYADLHGEETIWDLYCGIGTISLFLAKKAGKIYGVEIVPEAIENAKNNARKNGIENAEFYVGAAEEILPDLYEKSGGNMKADVITLDPPRKGCDPKLLDVIAAIAPSRIVYISCDPATLARDVKKLGESGYQLERVRCVDMFGQSGHVESVCLLHRRDS